jgi:hypothetical protein
MHPARWIDALHPDPTRGGAEIVAVARETVSLVNRLTRFAPGNGFCLSWPAAAVVAGPPSPAEAPQPGPTSPATLLAGFESAFWSKTRRNGWPDLGGGGVENVAAVHALRLMLVRVVGEGARAVLHLFPGWPIGAPATFDSLRVAGAFLVSASRDGSGASAAAPVRIFSERGGSILVAPMFGDAERAGLCTQDLTGRETRLPRAPGGRSWRLDTVEGGESYLVPCSARGSDAPEEAAR